MWDSKIPSTSTESSCVGFFYYSIQLFYAENTDLEIVFNWKLQNVFGFLIFLWCVKVNGRKTQVVPKIWIQNVHSGQKMMGELQYKLVVPFSSYVNTFANHNFFYVAGNVFWISPLAIVEPLSVRVFFITIYLNKAKISPRMRNQHNSKSAN